jgi:hypothetical protein
VSRLSWQCAILDISQPYRPRWPGTISFFFLHFPMFSLLIYPTNVSSSFQENAAKILPDYTASHLRRLTSWSLPWEPQISCRQCKVSQGVDLWTFIAIINQAMVQCTHSITSNAYCIGMQL